MPICPRCQQDLPQSDFKEQQSRKTGFALYCRQCVLNKLREWRKANRNLTRKWRREDYARHREARRQHARMYYAKTCARFKNLRRAQLQKARRDVFDMLGGKCSCCGESRFEFLTLHHTNRDGAKERQKYTGQQIFYRILRTREINGYSVLCWNCNASLEYQGYCPHMKV